MSKAKLITLSTKKKLLLVGGVLFSVALITSIASTYAWYSVIEKGYIGDLNMQVSTDLELLMRMKDEDYTNAKSEYTKEDFGYDDDFYLHDVSGMCEDRWINTIDPNTGNPKFLSSHALRNPKTSDAYANKEEDYLQMEFFLKSNVDCAVMLGSDTSFTPDIAHNTWVANTHGRNVDDVNAIVDATRISFFSEDKYVVAKNNPDSPDTYYGGPLDLNNDGYYDYEADKEIVYGEYSGTPSFETYNGNDAPLVTDSVFEAHHKPGIKKFVEGSVSFKKENAVSIQSLIFDEETMVGRRLDPLLMLKANEEKRIVITIYLEGWDRNMTDLLDLASMDVKVSFVPLYNYKA